MKKQWTHNITCTGYITGDIEAFSERCPQEGKLKNKCHWNDITCKYFMGITTTGDDALNMKGCCEYLIDLKIDLVNKLRNYYYEGIPISKLEQIYKTLKNY